jgi:2-methylcitrate dehydratase PrpD
LIEPADKKDSLKELCHFVATRRFDEFPASTVEHAKHVIVDTLGVILAGSKDTPIERLAGLLGPSTNQKVSTRLGHPEKLSSMHAALLNGATGSSREFEEGNSKALGHPAIQLIPAALAHAESIGEGGKKFLEGVILGYEVAGRIGSSAPLRMGFHPCGTWGTVGAAAAVAKISALQPSEIFDIANIASSFGITSYTGNSLHGKNISQMYAGMSNYFGILSYHLFKSGFSSSPENLRVTFGQLISDGLKEERLAKRLGEGYFIESNYFKMYPTCRFTHSALDAFRAALQKEPVKVGQIRRIDVYTFKWALLMENPEPENSDAMRFSIPHLLGLSLATGSVSLKTIEEVSKYQAQVKDIAERTFVHEDEKINQMLPDKRGARVVIALQDGREIEGSVEDCEGGELHPYPVSQLESKFNDLATPFLGVKRTRKVLELLRDLESLDRVERLTDLLGFRTTDD